MSNQPHVAKPPTGDAIDDDGSDDGGREADVTVVAHGIRRAKCLRNGLILANALVWLVILLLLKVLILG